MSDRTTGSKLESKTAEGGTVRLLVDHKNEHYHVDQDWDCEYADWVEIIRYLEGHEFELLDDNECEPETMPWGLRWWACHRDGETFDD